MRDPLQIEQSFRTLQAELTYPASRRLWFAEIAQFLKDLDSSGFDAEPYLLEIWDRLVAVTSGFDSTGFNPEEILNTAVFLERLQSVSTVFGNLPEVGRVVTIIKESAAWLYACCGETSKMLEVLGLEVIEANRCEVDDQESNLPPRERLEWLLEGYKTQYTAVTGKIEPLLKRWTSSLPDQTNSTYVAVVERPLLRGLRQRELGGLRRIAVELHRVQKKEDDLRFEVAVVGAESDSRALMFTPVAAARRLLVRTGAIKNGYHFAGKIEFAAEYAIHDGASANFALAALFYCAALKLTGSRDQYAITPSVVLTGNVDELGKVLPVDENAIGPKVRAAFFSSMQYLVVPKDQLESFALRIRELEHTYPLRHLELLGIGQLQDLFFDRRLTSYQRIGNLRQGARWIWQHKSRVALILVILILLSTIGGLLYGPIDRNPVDAVFSGKMMTVKNAHGQVLEEIEVGASTVDWFHTYPHRKDFAAFTDINGDGVNEIIWGQHLDAEAQRPSYLHCKSVRAREYHWSIPLQFKLEYPHKPGMEDTNFTPRTMLADDFDGDGQPEVILLVGHYSFFPGIVVKVGATDGRILSTYVHSGNLATAAAQDLDEDGIQEIIVGGVNNAYQDPCLIVFDSRYIEGQGPTTPEYVVSGYKSGSERAYIRFPQTELSKVLADSIGLRSMMYIIIQPISRQLIIDFLDVPLISTDVRAGDVLVYFDFELNVLDFGTGDNFDWTANRLFQRGILRAKPDKQYWERYGKELLYWDGDRWQKGRHLNRRYLEIIASVTDTTKKQLTPALEETPGSEQ